MLEMMCAHITFNHPKRLEPLKIRYERIIKKLTGSRKPDALMDCILYYMNSHNDSPSKINIHEIEKGITEMHISESQYLAWWFLAKGAANSGDLVRQIKYYEIAVKIIHQLSDMIGDKFYRESFLHKFPISEILVPSEKLL